MDTSGQVRWTSEAGFFEELPVTVKYWDLDYGLQFERVEVKRLLKVPCCETKEEDEMSEADSSHLETLLRAHEEAMAGQRSKLDAAALASTFAPLLAAVAKLEGRRARVVDLSAKNLESCLGIDNISRLDPDFWESMISGNRFSSQVTEVPTGLRAMAEYLEALVVESQWLTEVPEWVGEMTRLRTLAVGADFGESLKFVKFPNEFHLTRALPGSIGRLTALKELRLQGFRELTDLPEEMSNMTGLEILQLTGFGNLNVSELPWWIWALKALRELRLEGLGSELPAQSALTELVWNQALKKSLSALTGLTILSIVGMDLLELPASIGHLTRLQTLQLRCLAKVVELPDMGALTRLTTLTLHDLFALRCVPASIVHLTGLQTLKLKGLRVSKLPSMGALTGLTSLSIRSVWLRALPASIGHLTRLETLKLGHIPLLAIVPASIEALTALRALTLTFTGHHGLSHLQTFEPPDNPIYATVARALPSFQRLERLEVRAPKKENALVIARSIRAWTLPRLSEFMLTHDYIHESMTNDQFHPTDSYCSLQERQQALGLPLGAEYILTCSEDQGHPYQHYNAAGEHDFSCDMKLVDHFREQQRKVLAFAGGLQRRLGSGSVVSWLDKQMVMLIADEVLERSSLEKEWQEVEEGEAGWWSSWGSSGVWGNAHVIEDGHKLSAEAFYDMVICLQS